jgi:hypothetical protein
MNSNTTEPNDGMCEFSIHAEPASINRLGSLFERLSLLNHREFRWQCDQGDLYEQLQPDS